MAKSSDFIAADGYIDVAEIVLLAKEIDKFAAKEHMKPAEIHCAGKVIPKFDKAKTKGEKADIYERKRAQPIKIKKSMPKAGARMKMQILLRNYKGLDETEFWDDYKAAVKALEQHSKVAEKFVAQYKKNGAKLREKQAAVFDKAVDALLDILKDAGIEEDDIAVGQSTMGKTMCVCVGKGLYVSIGKSDEEKFEKTLASNEEQDKPKSKQKLKKADKDDAKSSKKKAKLSTRDDEDADDDDDDDAPRSSSTKTKKVKKVDSKLVKRRK
jgi:hypothetical protein